MTSIKDSRRVTANDVAVASGVSRSTVSFVLNNTPGQTIPDHTRDLVREAAARLGYVPNASAQILAGGRSRFVILWLRDLPLGDVANALEQAAAEDLLEHGFIPVVAQSGGPSAAKSFLQLATALRPAAIVTTSPLDKREKQALRRSGNPRLVQTFASEDELLQPFVATGEAQAMHLAQRGHAEVAFVRMAGQSVARLVDARARGVDIGCEGAGVSFAGSIEWTGDLGGLVHSLSDFLRDHPGVSAVAAYNDQVALAVLAAARQLNLTVPSELAVVGADNLPMSGLLNPTLSTASYRLTTQPQKPLGALLIEGGEISQKTTVEIEIIVREST